MHKSTPPRTPLSQGILSDTTQNSFQTYSNHHGSFTTTGRNVYSPLITSPYNDEDSRGTPRQLTPTKSKPSNRPKSITELSLSDVEHDIKSRVTPPKDKRRLPKVTQEVIVVETDTGDVHQSGEVETRSFTIQSPARVICHSPSRDESPDGKQKVTKKKSLSFEESASSMTKDTSSGTSKKKKKKFVPVQSRYKQGSKKEDIKSRSLEISAITPNHPGAQISAVQKKMNRVTSTPFLMTSMYEVQNAADGSIFDQTRLQTVEPTIKESLIKRSKVRKDKENIKRKDMGKELTGDGKVNNELDQLTLTLNHARLNQITYLNRKAKRTFEKQEEKAKAEIYGLWTINRKLEKEIEALSITVKTQKLELSIDQILNTQIGGFKSLSSKLAKLFIKLSRLTDAIINTTHYLPIRNIKIDNEEKLLNALDESKRLLAETQAATRRNQPEVEELSSTSEVLMKTVKSEVSEQQKCCELLAACTTLMNQERSLQVQLLQDI